MIAYGTDILKRHYYGHAKRTLHCVISAAWYRCPKPAVSGAYGRHVRAGCEHSLNPVVRSRVIYRNGVELCLILP
jgi:hypothetical protein